MVSILGVKPKIMAKLKGRRVLITSRSGKHSRRCENVISRCVNGELVLDTYYNNRNLLSITMWVVRRIVQGKNSKETIKITHVNK